MGGVLLAGGFTGSVIGDGGFFDNDKYNNYWNPRDYNSSYAAQISGLTLSPSSALRVGTVNVAEVSDDDILGMIILGKRPPQAV